MPPVRVHLFLRRRRSTFLLYPLLYALRHYRRGQDGGKITSVDASRMMFLEPLSSQVAWTTEGDNATMDVGIPSVGS